MTRLPPTSFASSRAPALARRQPGGDERPLARVVGEGERPTVFDGRLHPAPEPAQEVGARGGQQVVAAQRAGVDGVERGEAGGRAVRQTDRDRAIQLDHRRGRRLGQPS